MSEFKFQSPIYNGVIPVPVERLCMQELNPNHTNNKQISALQVSILNSGFTSPIIVRANEEYDGKERKKEELLNLLNNPKEEKSGFNEYEFTRQMKSNRHAFEYVILDGSQRTGLIRMGLQYWLQEEEHIREGREKKWLKGLRPERPGVILLEYLAWREKFCVPALIVEGDESVTVLHDSARGSFQLNQVEQMVIELNKLGWDEKRISRELFIDLGTVKRFLSKEAFVNKYYLDDEKVLNNKRWIPEEDERFLNLRQKYIEREMKDFLKEE